MMTIGLMILMMWEKPPVTPTETPSLSAISVNDMEELIQCPCGVTFLSNFGWRAYPFASLCILPQAFYDRTHALTIVISDPLWNRQKRACAGLCFWVFQYT